MYAHTIWYILVHAYDNPPASINLWSDQTSAITLTKLADLAKLSHVIMIEKSQDDIIKHYILYIYN